MLRIVQDRWPACCDVRIVEGQIEFAIYNAMGGKHWVNITIVPYEVELALYRNSYIETLTPLKKGMKYAVPEVSPDKQKQHFRSRLRRDSTS